MSSSRDFLGPYQLLRMIRSGQTCVVWEARSTYRSERVAIKALLEHRKNDKGEALQLQHEAEVGKGLDHPCVIKIYEYCDQYQVPFLVMQLFDARNLKQELRERTEGLLAQIKEILLRAAEGLQYLHESGWAHCDVKPDNFLVDEQAQVKLIDFSIAKPLPRKRGWLNRVGRRGRSVQGTRSYMSPEHIRGERVDVRSDVYSYGCTCFELLAGRPPFTGVSPNELLNKHLRAAIPTLQALNPAVTTEFAALVARCLAKQPEQRPSSMRRLIDDLQPISVFRPGMKPKITLPQPTDSSRAE